MSLNVFSEHFSGIEGTRQSAKISYPLLDVFLLTLFVVMSGCHDWEDIKDFGEGRLQWLKKLGFFETAFPFTTLLHGSSLVYSLLSYSVD